MKRLLSLIPAILLFCVLLNGIPFQSGSAPATNPAGLVVPPEGGKTPDCHENKYYTEKIPPFRGAGGQSTLRGEDNPQTPPSANSGQAQGDVNTNNPIKIGLLIQNSSSVEAQNGAELALDEVNSNGGFNGKKFELVIKNMEGPWGTGSKQAVDMIFKDEVLAIVGSHDGRNAHLVEQATTKSNVCFVSAWSGDPTLSQAFTPWFFNCVPNHNQQAEMLAMEIRKNRYGNLTLVTDNNYDARSAFRSFVNSILKEGSVKPMTIVLENSDYDVKEICSMITGRNTDCLVLFTEPVKAEKIICGLKEINFSTRIYGSLDLLGESSPLYDYPEALEDLLLVTSGKWYLHEKSEFAVKFFSRFNIWPTAAAAYSFDAMKVVLQAVIKARGIRDAVMEALMSSDYSGATGTIKFDEKGNRISTNGLMQ